MFLVKEKFVKNKTTYTKKTNRHKYSVMNDVKYKFIDQIGILYLFLETPFTILYLHVTYTYIHTYTYICTYVFVRHDLTNPHLIK